jgi:hypothetical protein
MNQHNGEPLIQHNSELPARLTALLDPHTAQPQATRAYYTRYQLD